MQKIKLLSLSFFSGLCFFAAWPPNSLTYFIFVAWLPVLFLAELIQKKISFFFYCFFALLTWNALTTWWIYNSTDIGGISAIVANSLLMTIPLLAFFSIKKRMGLLKGLIGFICCWMLFEYIHLNWQLSWPWLSLGNVFAGKPSWIQWYEITGIGGGTLWILIVNCFIFYTVLLYKNFTKKKIFFYTSLIALLVFIPIFCSVLLGLHFVKGGKHNNIVIVQPNIDPYLKFESTTSSSQIEKLITLSEKEIDSSTRLVVWPETALSANVSVSEISAASVYQPVFQFIKKHPQITLLTGIETYQFLNEKSSSLYKRKTQAGAFYESYNAAIALNSKDTMQFYIKCKLVPGVETLPTFLNFLAPVFQQFGGTTGGYAKDTSSKVFTNTNSPFIAAPVICYESIYGEYIASYVQKGANVICIITNDGWWGNTPGHKQHLAYAKLRAIETRRWVARSANTGISAVINPYGFIETQKEWNTQATIKQNFPISIKQTFYVQHGDYLYQIFSVIAFLFLGWNLYLKFIKKR